MKKYNIYLLSALAGLTLLTTSCSDDFLDKKPTGQYTAETYYSSDDAVRKGTEPLYNRAWFNFNRRALIGMGSYRANDAWNPYVSSEFALFQVTGLTSDLSLAWSALYNVVTMSNATLKNIQDYCSSDVSESVKNAGMGECYLMRGWAYFYLLRGWGPNILFEDNQKMIDNPVQPLNTEADVLKFVIRDFEKAEELLPENGTDHHPSKYAAKAALAKALLAQSGWDASARGDHNRDQATLNRVVKLCDEVINCGQYHLLPDYADLFKAQNNDNDETILAMRWADPSTHEWGAMNATYSDLAFPEVTSDVNVWGGNLCATPDMIDIYNQDPADTIRRNATFFTPNSYYDYLHKSEGGYTYKHNWMQVKKGVLGNKADVAPANLEQMASPLNTYIQRLADVYLMKAEALLGNDEKTTNSEALAAINAVRERAGVKPYTELDFPKLVRERQIEFCMEYSNWWDMVTWYRWKPQTMLDFFNNKQHRGAQLREGDVIKNADGTLSYRAIPYGQNVWYITNPKTLNVYWNDFLAKSETDNTPVAGRGTKVPYTYDFNALCTEYETGYQTIQLNDGNIFMPYPESDVIQNPYLNKDPQPYDFGDK